MDLRIQVKDDNGGEQAQQLYRWLVRDIRLAPQVTIRPGTGGATPGQMNGGVLDLINLVLSNSIALGSLVTSITAFCRSSRTATRPGPVVILLSGDLPPVHVTDSSDLAQLVAALQKESAVTTGAESVNIDDHTG